jgi:UDP-N-acetylglucosamine 3-dehydrogenase
MLRVGVVGAGSMGSQHLRVYGELASKCELVAVAEMDSQRRELLRRRKDWEVFSDYREMVRKAELDAVSVALPNELHAEATIECLRNGLDVLVEKPMALSLADAGNMIDVAKKEDRILMVGHVERFNPAVQFIRKYVADHRLGELYYLSSRRLGFYPQRFAGSEGFGVSLDLAIHDIDVMRFITDRPAKVMYTDRLAKRSRREDYVNFAIRFGSTIGILEASWLSPYKIRQLLVNGEKGLAMVDYLAQTVEIVSDYKEKPELEGYQEFLDFDYEISKPVIRKGEPLKFELAHFLDCVSNRSIPISDGSNGLENLKLVI